MRATLTYNLPDDEDRFDAAVRSARLVTALREYLYATRQKLKHSDMDEAECRVVERCRTEDPRARAFPPDVLVACHLAE